MVKHNWILTFYQALKCLILLCLRCLGGGVNPRYERVLASFYTCCLELFLVARDKRHSTARLTALTVQASARNPISGSHKYRSIIMMSFRRHEVTRIPVLQRTTSTIKTRMPSIAFAHYGMTLLSVIPQARSDKESSATTQNFHNHDLDSSIRIRSLRNDFIECHSEGEAEEWEISIIVYPPLVAWDSPQNGTITAISKFNLALPFRTKAYCLRSINYWLYNYDPI